MNPCPSARQLEQLLDEELDDAERRSVSLHVADCSHCQDTLERLTETSEEGGDPLSWALRRGAGEGVASAPAPAPFLARLRQAPPSSGSWVWRAGAGYEPANPPGGVGANGFPTVPGYVIEKELGRGGMGVVYQARRVGLSRPVALKMILANPHAGPKGVERLRQEAEAVARLRHPNIVQIYDVGESEGSPYLALEFAEGGSLVGRLRGDPQPALPAARLVETLARAIHYAHEHHIIHRDLKPANILLAPPAEPGEYGLPKVSDFGLAKRLDEEGNGSHSGDVVGTPNYMAPEQAASNPRGVGPAADIWALGAVLYEMLTGRPPFKGATPLDTVVQVLHEEPVPPGRLRPGLPRDLETICLKCLQKEPARRYASASALADDLHRFRQGRPIRARPVGPFERAGKWARRRPLSAGLLVGILAVAVLGFAGVTWQWQEARLARDAALREKLDKEAEQQQAEQARAAAVEERKKARNALYFSRIAQSQLQWRVNDVVGALGSLAGCLPPHDLEDLRGWEWHYLRGLFQSELLTLNDRPGAAGGGVAFSPDGRQIFSVMGGQPGQDGAGKVRVWDAAGGEGGRALPAPAGAYRLALRPDGRRLALGTAGGVVTVCETASGAEVLRRPLHARAVAQLAFSPDGRLVASASWDRTAKIWDAASGEIRHVLAGHTAEVQSVAFRPDGRQLATGSWDNTVRLWDVATGQEVQTLRAHKGPVYGVAYSPDGTLLATASSNGNLKTWDLVTGRVVQSLTAPAGAVLSIAFSPDGRDLAFGSGDATVRVWDVESGVQRFIFRGHTAPVECVQFSPDAHRLVSCSPGEGAVKLWDLTRHPTRATLARTRAVGEKAIKVWDLTRASEKPAEGQTGPDVEALAFDADGTSLVSVTVGGRLQVWDAESGLLKGQRQLALGDELVSPAVLADFAPGGRRLAARARADARLVLAWDVASGETVAAYRGHTLPVYCVRHSGDGRRLVTCGGDPGRADQPHEVKVWDAATGAELATFAGQGLLVSAALDRSGRWLALGGQDGAVLLADVTAGSAVVHVAGHKGLVTALAFSPDGTRLASAGLDRQVRVWNVTDSSSGREPALQAARALAAPDFLCDLAFSPDGRRLAGASRDVVKMWDFDQGQEVLSLRGAPQRHWDPPFNPRLAFSPDGRRLAATNWDESISLWEAATPADDDAALRQRAARQRAAELRTPFWHLQAAEDCLEHHNRSAALFHFERIGDDPLPAALQDRKVRLGTLLNR
jgi:WD40 repeat protein